MFLLFKHLTALSCIARVVILKQIEIVEQMVNLGALSHKTASLLYQSIEDDSIQVTVQRDSLHRKYLESANQRLRGEETENRSSFRNSGSFNGGLPAGVTMSYVNSSFNGEPMSLSSKLRLSKQIQIGTASTTTNDTGYLSSSIQSNTGSLARSMGGISLDSSQNGVVTSPLFQNNPGLTVEEKSTTSDDGTIEV